MSTMYRFISAVLIKLLIVIPFSVHAQETEKWSKSSFANNEVTVTSWSAEEFSGNVFLNIRYNDKTRDVLLRIVQMCTDKRNKIQIAWKNFHPVVYASCKTILGKTAPPPHGTDVRFIFFSWPATYEQMPTELKDALLERGFKRGDYFN